MKHWKRQIREVFHLNKYEYELYEWVTDYKGEICIVVDRKYTIGSLDVPIYRLSYINDNEPKWSLSAGIKKRKA